MRKLNFKIITTLAIVGCNLLSFSGSLFADPSEMSSRAIDECSKELLLSYFPKAFVNETLRKYNVSNTEWDAINQELAAKDKDVIKIVEEKATAINPNLLKDPQQRQAVIKIFRETLLDVFSKVLKDHGVKDDMKIQQMLDDIQKQKAIRFKQCMEQHRTNESEYDDNEDIRE